MITQQDFLHSLIGMSKDDAFTCCNDNNYSYRIVREDTNDYIVTCDLNLSRINISIDNGIVTNVNIG